MLFTCFLKLFLFYQVVRPLGRKSVNKYLCVYSPGSKGNALAACSARSDYCFWHRVKIVLLTYLLSRAVRGHISFTWLCFLTCNIYFTLRLTERRIPMALYRGRARDAELVQSCGLSLCVLAGVYLWILGQADVMLADVAPSAKTAFDYEIYMKECHVLWGQGEVKISSSNSSSSSSSSLSSALWMSPAHCPPPNRDAR